MTCKHWSTGIIMEAARDGNREGKRAISDSLQCEAEMIMEIDGNNRKYSIGHHRSCTAGNKQAAIIKLPINHNVMKWFKQRECGFFLCIIASWLLPSLLPYRKDAVANVVVVMTFVALCWVPLSFLIHLIQEGGLNLRRWLWLGALLAEGITLMLASPLHLPDTMIYSSYAGIAVAPFLYILICISETWMPWLNRPRLRAFITDLDL